MGINVHAQEKNQQSDYVTAMARIITGHEKAYEEQENIFKGSDRDPSSKDLCEMKYLERVIKETMRMYPIVAVMGRVLKEAVEVGKKNNNLFLHLVPAGMRVIFVPYLTHNLEEYYPNPKVFDPDRFVPEKIANRHPYSFIPFSAGPRNCIGQKFAMLEVKTVLSFVIRHYKFEATGEIPKFLPEVIVRPENGIHLKMTRRTEMGLLFLAVSSLVAACLLVIYFLPRLRSYWRYLAAAEKLPAVKGRIPIFGNALQVAVPQNQLVAKVEEMHKSNKSLFVGWAGPFPFLVVADPKYVEASTVYVVDIIKLD
ncbi:hypothetical protein C0J52_06756 [Blattella germanica]|nr:hypothetical protein C0J52_06756 [Blattella germanica]